MIAQIVNDKTVNWGGRGFAAAVRAKYPAAQEQFRDWGHDGLELGTGHLAEVGGGHYVFSMVAQHGYGPAPRMRLRYGALERCLAGLGARAAELVSPAVNSLKKSGERLQDLFGGLGPDERLGVLVPRAHPVADVLLERLD